MARIDRLVSCDVAFIDCHGAGAEGVRVGAGRAGAMGGAINLVTRVPTIASDGYRGGVLRGRARSGVHRQRDHRGRHSGRRARLDYQGPFRIAAPGDTRGARSVRMLERLDLVRLGK
ncbi:MAG: hypothetical protein AB7N65_05000 [Vicinamibacterales bacterium]